MGSFLSWCSGGRTDHRDGEKAGRPTGGSEKWYVTRAWSISWVHSGLTLDVVWRNQESVLVNFCLSRQAGLRGCGTVFSNSPDLDALKNKEGCPTV